MDLHRTVRSKLENLAAKPQQRGRHNSLPKKDISMEGNIAV